MMTSVSHSTAPAKPSSHEQPHSTNPNVENETGDFLDFLQPLLSLSEADVNVVSEQVTEELSVLDSELMPDLAEADALSVELLQGQLEGDEDPVAAASNSPLLAQTHLLMQDKERGIDVRSINTALRNPLPALTQEVPGIASLNAEPDETLVESWTNQFLMAKNLIKQQVNAEGLQAQQLVKTELNQLMNEQLKMDQSIKLDQINVEKQAEDLAEFKQVSQSQPSSSPKGANAQVFQSQISVHLKQKEEWNKSFSQKITMMASQDIQRAKISINPERLGPVEVMVALEGKEARVMIQTAHQEIKEAFKDAIPTLEAMLSEQGMNLGDCDVYDESDQKDGHTFARLWADDAGDELTDESDSVVQITTHDGLIDRYA